MYVASNSDQLYAVTFAGSVKWIFDVPGDVTGREGTAPFIGGDGTVYVVGNFDRILCAVHPDTGEEKWCIDIGCGAGGLPGWASMGKDGTIYTGDCMGLVAIGRKGFNCECPDSDGDGVPDAWDDCPDTPTGSAVDNRGCPVRRGVVVVPMF